MNRREEIVAKIEELQNELKQIDLDDTFSPIKTEYWFEIVYLPDFWEIKEFPGIRMLSCKISSLRKLTSYNFWSSSLLAN